MQLKFVRAIAVLNEVKEQKNLVIFMKLFA